MLTAVDTHEEELRADIAALSHDPLAFTLYAYPWGEKELSDSPGPRRWQTQILKDIGAHLQNPATRYQPLKIAVASGKGIGKSALVAMIEKWAMSTCEDCKIVVTANTGTQLQTKTVPEVHKWTRLAINRHWWDPKATSVTIREKSHEREWRTDFIPWSKENMEAFSGLHNKGKRLVVIFDEASGIDDTIFANTESTLTDEDTEILWFVFGNPTRPHGRFRECFGKYKASWKTYQIDARTVEGTNHEEQQRQIEAHGEDSYHVRIWIRGEFPLVGSDQFISPEDVEKARRYKAEAFGGLPKILACDVARFGDDQTVIGWRQGRKAVVVEKLRGKDTVFVAERVIHWQEKEGPDATVIDGDGLGAGVVDHIKHRGFTRGLFEFHGGATANEAHKYLNRRSEVWGAMRDWLSNGAEIPNDPELADDLIGPLYDYNSKGQLCLEMKDDMKARGLSSPDCGDMLAMTFSVKVMAKAKPQVQYVTAGSLEGSWMA